MEYPLQVIDLMIVIKNSSRKMFVRSVLQTDRFGNFIFEVEDYRYFVYRESPILMMIFSKVQPFYIPLIYHLNEKLKQLSFGSGMYIYIRPWLDTFNQDKLFKQHDFPWPMSVSVHIKYSSCDCCQTTNPIRFCLFFFLLIK